LFIIYVTILVTYAAFTHAGLTTRYRTKSLYKVFSCWQGHAIYRFIKRIESLINIAGIKFEFENLEIRFHKRQVSFLVAKTAKCKRGITLETVSFQKWILFQFFSRWVMMNCWYKVLILPLRNVLPLPIGLNMLIRTDLPFIKVKKQNVRQAPN